MEAKALDPCACLRSPVSSMTSRRGLVQGKIHNCGSHQDGKHAKHDQLGMILDDFGFPLLRSSICSTLVPVQPSLDKSAQTQSDEEFDLYLYVLV